MDNKTLYTLIVTVCLAVTGYVVNFLTIRRKDQLERLDRQLRDLYGPLYALTSSAHNSWLAFRNQIGRPNGSFWHADPPPNAAEMEAWRLWMRHVMMPINLKIEEAIVKHSDLLVGSAMPECLIQLIAHFASYKAVLKSWDEGDFSRHIAIKNYPADADDYIRDTYLRLKARQQKLIGNAMV